MLNICLILIRQLPNYSLLCVQSSSIDNSSGNLTLDMFKVRYWTPTSMEKISSHWKIQGNKPPYCSLLCIECPFIDNI